MHCDLYPEDEDDIRFERNLEEDLMSGIKLCLKLREDLERLHPLVKDLINHML